MSDVLALTGEPDTMAEPGRAGHAPLLVLVDGDSPFRFAGYVTELLHVEGYNWFVVHDLSRAALVPAQLDRHQVVIATHAPLSADVQAQLLAYVRAGGNLVAMRPPEALAAALGLTPAGSGIADGSLSLNPLCALNAGAEPLAPATPPAPVYPPRPAAPGPPSLQFHGHGDLYWEPRNPSQVVAYFEGVVGLPTAHPAVAIGSLGRGAWCVFAYDLAESTVLLHQGRREQASTAPGADADGDRKYTLNDHFVGYLDPDRVGLPQADLHQDILVRVLEWMAALTAPLPRLWPFPNGAPAVAYMRGDGDSMSVADFASTVETAERYGARFTFYLMLEDHPKVSPEWLERLRRRGHDFGQHVYAGDRPAPAEMRARLRHETAVFRARYGYSPLSYCGHGRVWVGWADMASYLHENGVRLNGSYGPGRTFHHGYLGGTGLPVRFVDDDGRPIDVYHQNILSSDDGWVNDKMFLPALSIEACLALSRSLVDDAVDRFHTVYHGSFHPVRTRPGPASTQRWLEDILSHCRARGVPFVAGGEWADFNDGRRGLRLVGADFDVEHTTLDLAFEAPLAVSGVTLTLPHVVRGRALRSAMLDGQVVPAEGRTLEGRPQVLLPADYAAGQRRRWQIVWAPAGER